MPRWVQIAMICCGSIMVLNVASKWWSERQTLNAQPDMLRVLQATFANPEWRGLRISMARAMRPVIRVEGTVPSTQSLTALQQAVNSASTQTRVRVNATVLPTMPQQAQDIGPLLHQIGRRAIWRPQQMALGSTGYVASIGPVVYEDESNSEPDYYTIEVEKSDGAASHVHFHRDFTIDAIPAGLIEKPLSEVISFDERLRTVTFRIGDQIVQYRLPGP